MTPDYEYYVNAMNASAIKINDYEKSLTALNCELAAIQSAMYDGLYLAELKKEAAVIKSKITRTQNKLSAERAEYTKYTAIVQQYR